MEMKSKTFENYPFWIIFITNLQNLILYIAGIYLLLRLGFVWAILYSLYVALLEMSVYKKSCVYCCYYGKRCAFNRGKMAKLFFKKKDPQIFCKRKISFIKLLPSILVSLMPIVVGVFLLIQNFDWLILVFTLIPVFIWFIGNPIVYGKLVCIHCAQRQICCPASEVFNKKKL